MLGLRSFFAVTADIPVAASVAPVTSTLSSPIAANQRQKLRWWIPITVGAAGGVRAVIAVPAGGSVFNATFILYNNVAPSITTATQSASAAFTNALANAGRHFLVIEADIENGATAGTVDLQMAQNTSDATAMTILKGASLEVITF